MSFRFKTILGIALIELVLLGILITTILAYMRSTSEQALVNYASTTSRLFATTTKDAVLSYDLASLDSFVGEILTNEGVLYARVSNDEGQVLAEGGDQTLLNKAFKLDTNFDKIQDGVFDARSNISEAGQLYGTVELGISTASIEDAIDDAQKRAGSIAAMEMLLVALFSFVLGTFLTKQLKTLAKGAKSISQGDLDHQVEVKGRDEIAEVAISFNTMTDSLKVIRAKRDQYQRELETLNTELEERVQRRTEQLSKKNNELETAYEELKHTQAKLVHTEKLASLGQLAAGVAHEINNPIAFIKSNLATLTEYVAAYQSLIEHYDEYVEHSSELVTRSDLKDLKQKIETIKSKEDLEYINNDIESLLTETIVGTNRVSIIVAGLRDFSHRDNGELEQVDMNECIESALTIANNQVKYKCKVKKELSPLPLLACNKGKMNQVLLNFIINASQSIVNEGTITIRSIPKENEVIIEISDDGEGIKKENINKLFDPFFTTKPVGQGTGLGLSISHGIIEEHHGYITVESEVGVGTTFQVHLPVPR
ncbi:MAG: two-component system NtrC family sensor kinase [Oleiphilaceae bacterium]